MTQMITSTRTTSIHSANIKCTLTTEAIEDTFTPIPEMSNSMHLCNPDSNSRKVTGQRITTASDQANHLSEMKPIGTGTRRLTLDHTAWTWRGSIDVDNYNEPTIHYPMRHSSAQTNQRTDTPRTTPGTTDSCTDYII